MTKTLLCMSEVLPHAMHAITNGRLARFCQLSGIMQFPFVNKQRKYYHLPKVRAMGRKHKLLEIHIVHEWTIVTCRNLLCERDWAKNKNNIMVWYRRKIRVFYTTQLHDAPSSHSAADLLKVYFHCTLQEQPLFGHSEMLWSVTVWFVNSIVSR